jgi:hypothetical protein
LRGAKRLLGQVEQSLAYSSGSIEERMNLLGEFNEIKVNGGHQKKSEESYINHKKRPTDISELSSSYRLIKPAGWR